MNVSFLPFISLSYEVLELVPESSCTIFLAWNELLDSLKLWCHLLVWMICHHARHILSGNSKTCVGRNYDQAISACWSL